MKDCRFNWTVCVCVCVSDHWMDPHCDRHSHLTPVWKGTALSILYVIKDPPRCVLSLSSVRSLCADGLVPTAFHSRPPWPFQKEIETNHDLICTFRHDIMTYMNESNVAQFLRCYNSRTALELKRPIPGVNLNGRTLKWVALGSPTQSPFIHMSRDWRSTRGHTCWTQILFLFFFKHTVLFFELCV